MKIRKNGMKQTIKNLRRGLKGENKLAKLYLKAAEVAKSEGANEASAFFRKAAKEEKGHVVEIEKVLHEMID